MTLTGQSQILGGISEKSLPPLLAQAQRRLEALPTLELAQAQRRLEAQRSVKGKDAFSYKPNVNHVYIYMCADISADILICSNCYTDLDSSTNCTFYAKCYFIVHISI